MAERLKGSLKSSVLLLVVLGLLFAVPIATKTFAAHGILAAAATAVLVVLAVLIGPLSFGLAGLVSAGFIDATVQVATAQTIVVSATGLFLAVIWAVPVVRGVVPAGWYLPVVGWALMGAYFCVSVVFAHAA